MIEVLAAIKDYKLVMEVGYSKMDDQYLVSIKAETAKEAPIRIFNTKEEADLVFGCLTQMIIKGDYSVDKRIEFLKTKMPVTNSEDEQEDQIYQHIETGLIDVKEGWILSYPQEELELRGLTAEQAFNEDVHVTLVEYHEQA